MQGKVRARSALAVVVLGLIAGSTTAGAQSPVPPTAPQISASGATAFGFTAAAGDAAVRPISAASVLPPDAQIASMAGSLVERVWRASPTFRRQCERLAEAGVRIVITLDFPQIDADSNAESVISHKGGVRAHIRLRSLDSKSAEHLAHEIEHVLEQLDQIDLRDVVANGVRGAWTVSQGGAFETTRAIAVGRAVAREVRSYEEQR